jgi:magnesium transporter
VDAVPERGGPPATAHPGAATPPAAFEVAPRTVAAYNAPGPSPGMPSKTSNEREARMIKRFQVADGGLVPVEAEDAPVQLFVNPEAAERDLLRARFRVDEHTLSSALDPDEVSRLEATADHLMLIWKRPTNYSGKDTFFFNVASIGMLLFEGRLAVIVTDNLPLVGGPRQVLPLRRPMDVMLGLVFSTIQHYLEHLKVIKMIARDLQEKINLSMENKHLIQMFNLSESLIYYLNAINSNGAVLMRLRTHAETAGWAAEDIAFIDDLIIENNQCYKQAEIYSTVFSGLMDARGNLVNNNMNTLLKNLTLINIVFLPLNLIASVGGMSEFSAWTSGLDWRVSYALFMVAMVVIGWVTARVLQRVDFGGGPIVSRRKKQRPTIGGR